MMKHSLLVLYVFIFSCNTSQLVLCAEKKEQESEIKRVAANFVLQLSDTTSQTRPRRNSFGNKPPTKNNETILGRVQRLRSYNFKSSGNNDSAPDVDTQNPLSLPASPTNKRYTMPKSGDSSQNTRASFSLTPSSPELDSLLENILRDKKGARKYTGLTVMQKFGISTENLIEEKYRKGARQYPGCNLLKIYPTKKEFIENRKEMLDATISRMSTQMKELSIPNTKILNHLHETTAEYVNLAFRMENAIKNSTCFKQHESIKIFNDLNSCLNKLYQAQSMIGNKNQNPDLYQCVTYVSYYPALLLNILVDHRSDLCEKGAENPNPFIEHWIDAESGTEALMKQYIKISASISVLLHFTQEQRAVDDKYAYELITACSPFIQAQMELARSHRGKLPVTNHLEQYLTLANALEEANQ